MAVNLTRSARWTTDPGVAEPPFGKSISWKQSPTCFIPTPKPQLQLGSLGSAASSPLIGPLPDMHANEMKRGRFRVGSHSSLLLWRHAPHRTSCREFCLLEGPGVTDDDWVPLHQRSPHPTSVLVRLCFERRRY